MTFSIKQNDTSPSLQAILKDADLNPVDLTGASVRLLMKSIGGDIKVNSLMTITSAANGEVQYDWTSSDTDTVGTYNVEFEVTYGDLSVETFPNSGYLSLNVVRGLN